MASTINNEATTTYQFTGSSEVQTATSNENTITLEDSQGLTITKSATPTEFVAGDIIAYTITITNNSASYLTGVRIIDDLGGGNLAYVSGSGSLNTVSQTYPVSPVATNPLTFTLQQLNVGGTLTLTYRCQVIFNLPSSVSSITNNVRGIGYTSSGTVNGASSFTIQKKNSVSMDIRKTASVTEVYPNQSFSYFITLTNNSDTNAVAQSTIDQLPSNFVLTGVSLKIGSGATTTLSSSDYSLTSANLLTVPSLTGPVVSVPANGSTVITITGYFS